jgi:3-hydroxyisobutyrate dehydrogenase-like beta-hydroxyacid dehydrogenase
MKVAFVGLGRMGGAIANRLLDTGLPLTVWNRTEAKARPFAERGAEIASDVETAVAGAEIVLSSLMDDASVEAQFGPSGPAFGALSPAAVHVSLTTISPGCADRLETAHAARGVAFVSGPVVGRPDAAATGTLLQFLAGDATAMARIEPVCAKFAQRVVRLSGSAGAANRQKLCTNFFVIAIVEAMGEALAFAERCGASTGMLSNLFEHSFAAPALQGYARRLQAHETSGADGFSLRAGRKDLALIHDEAQRCGCRLEIADVIARKMAAASARGLDDCDWSVIAEISRTEEAVR